MKQIITITIVFAFPLIFLIRSNAMNYECAATTRKLFKRECAVIAVIQNFNS